MQKHWLIIAITILSTWAVTVIAVRPVSAAPPRQDAVNDGVYLPLVFSPCPAAQPRPKNVFGVQMYGDSGVDSPYFKDMVDSQTSWVRNEVSWRSAEPRNVSPAEYRWENIDKVLSATAEGGVNMIGTINFNPGWAADSPTGPIKPEHLDDFAEFLTALVERYDGDGVDDEPCGRVVKHWEFFNEPDNRDHWGNDGDRYAQMLAFAYPAIKAADPETQVLFGGIAYVWFEDQNGPFVRSFLTDVLDAGGGAQFDVMNFHTYPPFAPEWTMIGPGLYEKTAAIRQVLAGYGLDKPFMITEAGMHDNAGPGSVSTPEIQASYVIELFTQAKAADINALSWFMLYDPPEPYPYKNGLVTADNPPRRKLAFHTFRLAVDRLASADYDRQLTDSEMGDSNMLAYRFVQPNDGAGLYVAWMNPVGTGQTATLSLPGEEATIYDIYTNTHTVRDNDDGHNDGRMSVHVSWEPIIVEVN